MTKVQEPPVRIAIIGAGAVSDYHHVPGIQLDRRAALVAVCDSDPELLKRRRADWSVDRTTTDYRELCEDVDIDAVIIATPNFTHLPISATASLRGKHVMCEKPFGLNADEVRRMYLAARDAGVVHMTAFTYRFAPPCGTWSICRIGRVGDTAAFSQPALLDWPETSWGWRQYRNKAPGRGTCSI